MWHQNDIKSGLQISYVQLYEDIISLFTRAIFSQEVMLIKQVEQGTFILYYSLIRVDKQYKKCVATYSMGTSLI